MFGPKTNLESLSLLIKENDEDEQTELESSELIFP